jgi:hypothetical protein
LPFVAYADFFGKRSLALSRAQELQADAVSARVAGAEAAASALRKIEVLASAWNVYWGAEVRPLLEHGCLAPLLAGFDLFWGAAQTPGTPAFEALSVALRDNQRAHVLDSHPTLAERLAALGCAPEGDAPERKLGDSVGANDPSALGLLDDVEAVEERVLRELLNDPKAPLRAVRWEAIAEDMWLPTWRKTIEQHTGALARVRVRDLPAVLAGWQALADSTRRGLAIASPAAERRRVTQLLGVWLVVTLADRGYQIDAAPGRAVTATRDGQSLQPFTELTAMRDAPDPAAWERTCDAHGLA